MQLVITNSKYVEVFVPFLWFHIDCQWLLELSGIFTHTDWMPINVFGHYLSILPHLQCSGGRHFQMDKNTKYTARCPIECLRTKPVYVIELHSHSPEKENSFCKVDSDITKTSCKCECKESSCLENKPKTITLFIFLFKNNDKSKAFMLRKRLLF